MPVRAAPRSSSFGSLVLFARRTTTSIFSLRSFFCSHVFFVWCGLQKRVVRPPPLDDDDDKESFDGVVTSFGAFFQCPILSLD